VQFHGFLSKSQKNKQFLKLKKFPTGLAYLRGSTLLEPQLFLGPMDIVTTKESKAIFWQYKPGMSTYQNHHH
jgi:hypothetical protein